MHISSDSRYEVIVTVWNDTEAKQVKTIAGTFDRWFNAKLFADAYAKHFNAKPEIIEYKRTRI